MLSSFSSDLTLPQRLKFLLLEQGMRVAASARDFLDQRLGPRPWTLADYASTSGISLVLEDDVWVNVPIEAHNPDIARNSPFELAALPDGLYIRQRAAGIETPARVVPVPAYHDQCDDQGNPFTDFAHTHTDRVRLSPVRGCAMHCHFCDIPYEFKGRYLAKAADRLIAAGTRALADPVLPAAHILISGGTPIRRDRAYLQEVYQTVLAAFPGVPVDVMMVPDPEIVNVEALAAAGVHEVSLNLDLFDPEALHRFAPEKYAYGTKAALAMIERAVETLGCHTAATGGGPRVRSMLLAGLEPIEQTLAGVDRLAAIGAVPVLSPFRPDPATPLRDYKPPDAASMATLFLRARDIAGRYGIPMGPGCLPCTHNTLTLSDGSPYYHYHDLRPATL